MIKRGPIGRRQSTGPILLIYRLTAPHTHRGLIGYLVDAVQLANLDYASTILTNHAGAGAGATTTTFVGPNNLTITW